MSIDLKTLSAEQKADLIKQLEAEELQRKQKIQEDRKAYKQIADEAIAKVFGVLSDLSERLSEIKGFVYNNFGDIIDMKKDVYGEKTEEQYSHTFTSSDGTMRITLGYHVTDDYDDTVNVGVEKVKEYISSLGRDDNSKQLVGAVLRLLSKDQKGNLKASRVMQLSKMADDSGNVEFIDAVKIIHDAYRPQRSKSYIIAKYRNPDSTNEWITLPLGITEA